MITFKLLNYPPGVDSWEVYLVDRIARGSLTEPIRVQPREGDLVVSLYRGTTPTWRWAGSSTAPDNSTVEVNAQAGKVCLVTEPPLLDTGLIKNPILAVAGLGLLALVGSGWKGWRQRK